MWINFGLVALGAFLMLVFGWVREGIESDRENKREMARRAAVREDDLHCAIEEARQWVRDLQLARQRLEGAEAAIEFMKPIVVHLSKKDSGVM